MSRGVAQVFYNIQDLSIFTDEIAKGYSIMIGESERGTPFEPYPFGSWEEFERECGRTFLRSNDPLVFKMGAQQGAKFIFIRLLNCTDPGNIATMTAKKASLILKDRGGIPTPARLETKTGPFTFLQARGGRITGTEIGPFSFVSGADKMRFALSGGENQDVILDGTGKTAQEVVDMLNAGTNGITFSAVDNRIKAETNDPTHSLEIRSISDGANNVLGLPIGVYAAVEGTQKVVLGVDGGNDQTFTLTPANNETESFILTAGQVVEQLAGLTGAIAVATQGRIRITSNSAGITSSLQLRNASTAEQVLGVNNDVVTGTEGTPQDTIRIIAHNEGDWGNFLKIQVYDSDLNPNSNFDIRVAYTKQGGLNEYYDNLSLDPESDRYFVNAINNRSRLIRIEDLYSANVGATARPAVDEVGTFLSQGTDGDPLTTADWIGDELAMTGMYACNKTDMAIHVLLPGTTNISVIQALTAFVERRGDLIAHVNTPVGLDPINSKKWRMGEEPYSHEMLDSHRLAVWFGRPLCYDSRDDSRKYISNLGHLGACLSKTEEDYEPHFAPVGPRRGKVDFVEGIDFNLADYRGYEDMFADYGINGLKITPWEGAVFWEQRTTQRAASSLRDLNVVVFLTVMRKILVPVLRTFLFEPNHPMTWREVYRVLEPQFRLWKAKCSVYDFCLQTDRDAFFDGGVLKNAVLNSGLEIDQGIYRARALVQPTKAIYYIDFEVGVTRTGAAFDEYTELKELPGWVKA